MRAGTGLVIGGGALTAAGCLVIWGGGFLIGVGMTVAGVLLASVGVALLAEPDPVGAEVDRWEAEWGAAWSPDCPIHGPQMCYVRTRKCPAARSRTAP